MEKYAFIVMMPALDPASYRLDFPGRDLTTFIGVSDMNQAQALVREFYADGYRAFNLCGAFDQAKAEQLAAAAGPDSMFSYVTFEGDEKRKRENADINQKLGIIIYDAAVGQIHSYEFPQPLRCSVRFVDSLVMACRAAKELILEGASVIETCSWFDGEKIDAMTSVVRSEVPIGTAGRTLVRG